MNIDSLHLARHGKQFATCFSGRRLLLFLSKSASYDFIIMHFILFTTVTDHLISSFVYCLFNLIILFFIMMGE